MCAPCGIVEACAIIGATLALSITWLIYIAVRVRRLYLLIARLEAAVVERIAELERLPQAILRNT